MLVSFHSTDQDAGQEPKTNKFTLEIKPENNCVYGVMKAFTFVVHST